MISSDDPRGTLTSIHSMRSPADKYARSYVARRCAAAIGVSDVEPADVAFEGDWVYRKLQVHVRKRNGELAGVAGMFNYRFLTSLEDGRNIYEDGQPLDLEEFIYECSNEALAIYIYHWEEEE